MDRETALQDFQKKAAIKIAEFRNGITAYVLERAEALEELVRTAAERLGEQMEKQGKESVSFLYFSILKTDFIGGRHRIMLHALDMQWYLDEAPAEVYVDAGDLFAPLMELWDALTEAGGGYGGAVNRYDITHLIFDQLPVYDTAVSYVLRWRLRDWEKKSIFESVPRTPYWLVKWGQYRDQTETLLQTDRTKKEASEWAEALAKARHKPDRMVFSYWYQGTFEGGSPKEMDMRFITFEECEIKNMDFKDCNLEGSRFVKCTFSDCTFPGCNLWGADFRGCRFERTSFEGAELSAAVFPAESVPFLNISAEQLQVIGLDREEEA